jgi:hypothetical protein
MLQSKSVYKGHRNSFKTVLQTNRFFCKICDCNISYTGIIAAAMKSHRNRSSVHKEKEAALQIESIEENRSDDRESKKRKSTERFDELVDRSDVVEVIDVLPDKNDFYWSESDAVVERFKEFNDRSVVGCQRSSQYGKLHVIEVRQNRSF